MDIQKALERYLKDRIKTKKADLKRQLFASIQTFSCKISRKLIPVYVVKVFMKKTAKSDM